jgi:hypothetical protein
LYFSQGVATTSKLNGFGCAATFGGDLNFYNTGYFNFYRFSHCLAAATGDQH